MGFRAVARGILVIASKDRCGPIPLLLGVGGGETKCCATGTGTVMLRGRFLPVRGGVLRRTAFLCQL
jgi:hypothetical protein